jgi:hypothetical protein
MKIISDHAAVNTTAVLLGEMKVYDELYKKLYK